MLYNRSILPKGALPVTKRLLALLAALALLLCGCGEQHSEQSGTCQTHADGDDNGICDDCGSTVIVVLDLYAINDLHGKIADASTHPGVDEMTTYLRNAMDTDDNVVLLSSGDMWQGSSESNMTKGHLTTDWMNELDFAAMTLGNHEFDWGEDPVQSNAELAEFPLLAINIYDRATNKQAAYCQSSVMVERSGVQIGIIGAIGDCYSSIAPDKVEDIYFKTGSELTELVKQESQRLRSQGADFIVYSIHDGFEQSKGASVTQVTGRQLSYYYDTSLSNGYVDLVFEGHTHQRYLLQDEYGVYHLQNGGDNKGISHAEVIINPVAGTSRVLEAELVTASTYARLEDDPIVQELLDRYDDQISPALRVVGTNAEPRQRDDMRQLVADLYYQAGLEKWGQEYDIALGGGFISIRDPGYLAAGEVTYAMLQALFPFDNELVLCSIKGRDLMERFFESDHYSYFISYGLYGEQVRGSIDPNGTYYVIVDTYSSTYGPNRLTEIARYGENIFARDLLADYIESGGLN